MTHDTVKKIHHFSGLLLISFIAVHLLNHIMIFYSVDAHISFMTAFRKVYRFPPIEVLLLTAVLVQVISGSRLLYKKWKLKNDIWDKLQMYSGAYFIYFLIVHVSAVLFGRYVWHLDTNVYFGAAVLNIKPILYYFVFHYGLAILAFFTHVGCVHRKKMQAYTSLKHASNQGRALIFVGCALSILIIYHMMGMQIPPEYLEGYAGINR